MPALRAGEKGGEAGLFAGGGVGLDDATLHRFIDCLIREREELLRLRDVLCCERFHECLRRIFKRGGAAEIKNALACRRADCFLC